MPGKLIDNIKTIEQKSSSSPLLHKAGKGNNMSTPTAYFEKLPDQILSGITKEKSTARLIYMPVLKWAAAACIIGVICFSIVKNYLSSQIEHQNNKEWQASLQMSKVILQRNSFDLTLNQLDENTIINFLQENGHDVNAALMASITETDHINDVNEYFCDDENLNLMMKDLNISENNN